jgi:hypothetical protein
VARTARLRARKPRGSLGDERGVAPYPCPARVLPAPHPRPILDLDGHTGGSRVLAAGSERSLAGSQREGADPQLARQTSTGPSGRGRRLPWGAAEPASRRPGAGLASRALGTCANLREDLRCCAKEVLNG